MIVIVVVVVSRFSGWGLELFSQCPYLLGDFRLRGYVRLIRVSRALYSSCSLVLRYVVIVKSAHGYHTLTSCSVVNVFPLIGLITRCHIPCMHISENLCVSSCAPSEELMLYAQLFPT